MEGRGSNMEGDLTLEEREALERYGAERELQRLHDSRRRLMRSPVEDRPRSTSFHTAEEAIKTLKRKQSFEAGENADEMKALKAIIDELSAVCKDSGRKDIPGDVKLGVLRAAIHVQAVQKELTEMKVLAEEKQKAKKQLLAPSSTSTQTEGRKLHVWGKSVVTFEEGAEITLKQAEKRTLGSGRETGPDVENPDGEWQEVNRKMKKNRTGGKGQEERGGADQGPPPNSEPKSKAVQSKKPMQPTVTVHAEGRSYAEILSQMKQRLKPEDLGGAVKSIRKSGECGLRIELSRPLADSNRMRKALEEAIPGAKVASRGTDQAVHVYGLDSGVTAEEVLKSVKEALKTHELADALKNARVTSVREAYLGMKNATVVLPRTLAEALAATKYLLVGFVSCRLRLREDDTRCFRCWEHDHMASSCSGKDMSKCCFNCSQPGHLASECTKLAWCSKCQQEGHRTGARNCKAKSDAAGSSK